MLTKAHCAQLSSLHVCIDGNQQPSSDWPGNRFATFDAEDEASYNAEHLAEAGSRQADDEGGEIQGGITRSRITFF